MPYIGVSPFNGVRRKHTYTATASQTSFSGAGTEGATLSYTDSTFVDVFQNGVKLGEADYTATSGTAIVLAQGASLNDLVEVVVYDVFSVADTVSKSAGGTFDGNITAAGTITVTGNADLNGDLDVDGTTNLDVVDIDGAVDMASTLKVDGKVGLGIDISTLPSFVNYAMKISNGGGLSITSPSAGDNRLIFFGTGTSSADIQLAGIKNTSSDFIFLGESGAERFKIHNNGVVAPLNGIALGVGTANTSSNVLDDYEQGTWTATQEGSTTNPSTAVTVVGTYTKIGNMCYAQFQHTNVNTTGAAGGVRVTGLPFAASGSQATGNVMTYVRYTLLTGSTNISPYVSGTQIAFYQSTSNGGWSEISHNAGTGAYLSVSVFYKTT